ncbi:uncharacterized protein LOC143260969 [Megalopta genalis]|uniref:uncharacterized protein LOC143260969 n=1 Tax=Megalopta genalis TaxID=115081 RepID=UPI003FD3F69C
MGGNRVFFGHLTQATTKAMKIAETLPNIGGGTYLPHLLYYRVVEFALMYAAPILSPEAGKYKNDRKLNTEDCFNERLNCVLIAILPLPLPAEKRVRLFKRQDTIDKLVSGMKTQERNNAIDKWQENWERSSLGGWIYRFIPKIKNWMEYPLLS